MPPALPARLLTREVQDNLCRYFSGVGGPEYPTDPDTLVVLDILVENGIHTEFAGCCQIPTQGSNLHRWYVLEALMSVFVSKTQFSREETYWIQHVERWLNTGNTAGYRQSGRYDSTVGWLQQATGMRSFPVAPSCCAYVVVQVSNTNSRLSLLTLLEPLLPEPPVCTLWGSQSVDFSIYDNYAVGSVFGFPPRIGTMSGIP